MENPNAEWGDEYEEFAVALENGEEKVLFGPFISFYHARQYLFQMETWEECKGKKLYVVKRIVKPWKPY